MLLRREPRGCCDALHAKIDLIEADLERQRREIETRQRVVAEIRMSCSGGKPLAACRALDEMERRSGL
jgi:hypothetical protein